MFLKPLLGIVPGFMLLISCASQSSTTPLEESAQAMKWTEKCPSCGNLQTYAYSFDDQDRELILDFTTGFKLKAQVYWKAPHGPSVACDSRYADLKWADVRELLPELKRETFESFLRRNQPVPSHRGSSWKSPDGRSLAIIGKGGAGREGAPALSRAGFNEAGTQALIYSGGGTLHLMAKREGHWVQVDGAVLWIS